MTAPYVWTSLALVLAAGAANAAPHAEYLDRYELTEKLAFFGGFSGLEFSPDGASFTALSDSAALVSGRVSRDETGAVKDVVIAGPPLQLRDAKGALLAGDFDDAEGLAMAPDGRMFIAFELEDRVDHYGADGVLSTVLPRPDGFSGFIYNSGPEALAIGPDSAIYAMPEGDAAGMAAIPVFRFLDGVWDQPFRIASDGTWRPVGADFGPDGLLYLLERDFWPLLGFRSRIRRFAITADDTLAGEVLFVSQAGRFGNLEGLSIWQDAGGGLRATAISDNNFLAIMESVFVDFAIRE